MDHTSNSTQSIPTTWLDEADFDGRIDEARERIDALVPEQPTCVDYIMAVMLGLEARLTGGADIPDDAWCGIWETIEFCEAGASAVSPVLVLEDRDAARIADELALSTHPRPPAARHG